MIKCQLSYRIDPAALTQVDPIHNRQPKSLFKKAVW